MSFTGQLLLLKAYVCASVFSILNAQKANANFLILSGNWYLDRNVIQNKKGTRVML